MGNDGMQGKAVGSAELWGLPIAFTENLELGWHQNRGDSKDQKVLAKIFASCPALLGTASALPKKASTAGRGHAQALGRDSSFYLTHRTTAAAAHRGGRYANSRIVPLNLGTALVANDNPGSYELLNPKS